MRAVIALLAATVVAPAFAATISGTVFEDVNYGGGAGRSLAASSGVVRANVRVELYRQSGAFVAATTTNASGAFTLTTTGTAANQRAAHFVRVVTGSVRSSRLPLCTTCAPVQTYRTDASTGAPVAVTNRVGGETPALSDAPSNLTSATYDSLDSASQDVHSVAPVDPVASDSTIVGVDFGFNFSTIVNTRDTTTSCTPTGSDASFFPCQGSLRQFIVNANALGGEGLLAQSGSGLIGLAVTTLPAGFESSIFMIPSAALTSNVAVITLAGALPSLTSASTRLDATTQTVNVGDTNGGSARHGQRRRRRQHCAADLSAT